MLSRKAVRERRTRVVAIVEELPEAGVVVAGNHLSLEVRQKRFGWLLEDHHNDGRLALNCKAPRGVAQHLVEHGSVRFHIPKYVGHLGDRLCSIRTVDWIEVKATLVSATSDAAPGN